MPLIAVGAMRALGLLMQLSSIGGALEVDLLDDFCQQLQASGVPAQEVHIMPVGKFEKPENAMRTPIYNSGGGGEAIAPAKVVVEEKEVIGMTLHLPNSKSAQICRDVINFKYT